MYVIMTHYIIDASPIWCYSLVTLDFKALPPIGPWSELTEGDHSLYLTVNIEYITHWLVKEVLLCRPGQRSHPGGGGLISSVEERTRGFLIRVPQFCDPLGTGH